MVARSFFRKGKHTQAISDLSGKPPPDGIGIASVVRTASGPPRLDPDGFGPDPAGPGIGPASSSVSPWAAVCPSMPGLIPRRPDAEAPRHCARPDRYGDAPRTTLPVGRRIGPRHNPP